MGTKTRGSSTLLLVALGSLAGACGGGDGQQSLAQKLCGDGFNAETGAVGELNLEASAQAKVKVFLGTSSALTKSVREIESDAIGACREMAADLGIPSGELSVSDEAKRTDPGAEIKTVCGAVAANIRKTIEENVPSEATLTVQWSPARCEVDVNVQRSCVQTCEQKTVTETEIQCKPGKLSGMCSGMCSGSCSATCMGMCSGGCTGTCMGTCEGTCTATCTGKCEGHCDGTCDVMGADGKCAGKCTGTCVGKCDAGCTGKCEGSCRGSCSATCTGSCSGGCSGSCTGSCSVMFVAPKCEEVEVMREVTQCTRTCDTQARASAVCTAPSVLVDFQTNLQKDPMRKQKIETLVAAVRKGLPRFLKATLKAKDTLGTSVDGYLQALGSVAGEVTGSAKAAACVGVAVEQNGRDGKKVAGAGQSNVDIIGALKAKGRAALMALACDGYDPAAGKKGPMFTGAAGVKLNAVMDASVSLVKTANEVETETLAACRAIGSGLGLTAADLAGTDPKAVCAKVKAEIDKQMAALMPAVKVRVVATPAVCTVNAMASFTCTQTCEMKTITQTDLVCKPGKLAGTCSAMCMGECRGSCNARCSGSCSAKCTGSCTGKISGSCTGTCMGTCEGTCMTMGANGQCAGQCMGTCTGQCMGTIDGSCEGTCSGTCSASCEGSCMGSCMGSCTGSCSVMFQAPYCEEVEVMREVTECQRSCEAKARAEAMCTAPTVSVVVESNLAEERMKAARLVTALKMGLPNLFKVVKRVRGTVEASADAYVNMVKALPDTIKNSGAMGAGCVAAVVAVSGEAAAKLKGSVEGAATVTAAALVRAN